MGEIRFSPLPAGTGEKFSPSSRAARRGEKFSPIYLEVAGENSGLQLSGMDSSGRGEDRVLTPLDIVVGVALRVPLFLAFGMLLNLHGC